MIKYLSLALVILILSGCSTTLGTKKIATPAQDAITKQEGKTEVILEKIDKNEKD
jgi:PBP1b-binding outer membrane lipoprotein LpoB